ncbi:MAG: DUF1501 domain-containing protein [Planctomycetota bacterium]
MDDNLDRLISRRSLLRRGSCATLGLAGLGSQLLTSRALAAVLDQQSFTDYKALVCVFLFGGNDNGNTLIPVSGKQSYNDYSKGRGNLAIPPRYLKPTVVTPTNTPGQRFALHPAFKGVHKLFQQGNAAVVANVGTLLEPTTLKAYRNGSVQLPGRLFAHDAQAEQWQLSRPDARDGLGWGGRLADVLQAASTSRNPGVSMNISIAGVSQFLSGREVNPYVLGPEGAATVGDDDFSRRDRSDLQRAYMDMLAAGQDPHQPNRHAMVEAVRDVTRRAVVNGEKINAMLGGSSRIQPPADPGENPLADQLHAVARLIEHAESKLNHKRQVFFVALGGFDNHDGLTADEDFNDYMGPHGELLRQVDQALTYFWDALGTLNKQDAVTTFTASDFGRTFATNGRGSDHGWGGHHLVLGGSQLNGNHLYGSLPNLRLNGPDDTGEGRFIPTTSVDAYGFEFARWMGVPLSEMPTVFPNLNRFLDPQNPATHLRMLA